MSRLPLELALVALKVVELLASEAVAFLVPFTYCRHMMTLENIHSKGTGVMFCGKCCATGLPQAKGSPSYGSAKVEIIDKAQTACDE